MLFDPRKRVAPAFADTQLLPYWGTGIAFVTEIIKPIHKARTCTTMQHLRLSTSRPIRPLPHSRQWTNVLPLSGPSLSGGVLPEGFAFSVTPTTADTLEGCTVGVNQGQSGKGAGGPSPGTGINPGRRRKVAAEYSRRSATFPGTRSLPRGNLPSNNFALPLRPGECLAAPFSPRREGLDRPPGTRGGGGPPEIPASF